LSVSSDKQIKGFFAWGMNPACCGANANKTREALGNLDWLVNVNVFDNETASFWKGPGMKPKQIKTEVFFLPCAAFLEKEGSISNSGRWAQWRYKAQEPTGSSKPDGDIIYELFLEIQDLYKKDKKAKFGTSATRGSPVSPALLTRKRCPSGVTS
jgi:formate dehydrogenase major subunit